MNEFLKKDLLPFFNNPKSLLADEEQKQIKTDGEFVTWEQARVWMKKDRIITGIMDFSNRGAIRIYCKINNGDLVYKDDLDPSVPWCITDNPIYWGENGRQWRVCQDWELQKELVLQNAQKDSTEGYGITWGYGLINSKDKELTLVGELQIPISLNKESLIHNQNYVDQQKLITLAVQEYYKTGCLYGSANMHRHLEDKILYYHDSSGHEFSCCNHCATEFLQLFTILDMKLRLKD